MNQDLPHINESEFETMKTEEKIIWLTGQYEIPQTISKEEAFNKLKGKIAEQKKEPVRVIKLTKRTYLYSAAASVLLLLGFWFLWPKPIENVVAAKGQHSEFKLPDGSKVSLNADTKISYNKKKFKEKRNLEMDGEAFFNVEKGSPFVISTSLAEIKVLGTSFNVYARENQFKVSCFTGKIKVSYGTQSQIIVPGQTAYIENNKLLVREEQNIEITAKWQVGEFHYENTSLNLVLNEIERQFNVTFVAPKIDEKTFSGVITNKNLVDALDIVCIPMGLTYEIESSNSKVYIKTKSD
jgi:transmembrane sensor